MVAEPALRAETVKVADELPAGTLTLAGTLATLGLLLLRLTSMPPAGAGPESPTLPEKLEPALAALLLSARVASPAGAAGGGAAGVAVSTACALDPLYEPLMFTSVDAVTDDVPIGNVVEVAPEPSVALAGTVTTDGFPLPSVTTTPGLGAGPLRVTVPVED